jgi:hypothetical protein
MIVQNNARIILAFGQTLSSFKASNTLNLTAF